MKPLLVILLFISSICVSQTKSDAAGKILGKWFMLQFGNTSQAENQYRIQQITTDTIWATFNENHTLDLAYSTKKETYKWKIKGDKIQIDATRDGDKNAAVVGKFEMNFWRNDTELALFHDDGSYRAVKFKRK